MKKIFISAAAIIAFAACTKNEIVTPNEQINFAPATYSLNTKADAPVDQDDPEHHEALPGNFGVYAWFTPTTGDANQPFMVNESVTPAGVTTNTYYWPKDGKIDFVGYYPLDATNCSWFNVTSNPKTTSVTQGYIYDSLPDAGRTIIDTTYTNAKATFIGTDNGKIKDLMYADEAIGYNKENGNEKTHFYNGVPMLFHHALSQLGVKVLQAPMNDGKGTSWAIEIQSLTIGGIDNVGTVAINGTNTVWTVKNAADKRYVNTFNTTQTLTGTATDYFKSFLVMPQPLAAVPAKDEVLYTLDEYNAKNKLELTEDEYKTVDHALKVKEAAVAESVQQYIQVTYKITTTRTFGAKTTTTETVTSKKLPFKTGSIAKWEMGKSYVYTLTFKPADLTDDIIKIDPPSSNGFLVAIRPLLFINH